MGRPFKSTPHWDEFFMGMAFFAASKSRDPITQHGAVIVDGSNSILSIGWNDAIKESCKKLEKLPCSEHAESIAMDRASVSIDSANVYMTGIPCPQCLIRMVGKGIKKVICGSQGEEEMAEMAMSILKESIKSSSITVERYTGSLNWMRDRTIWLQNNMPYLF